jgi:excisionase family DNA binding protein
MSAIGIPKLLTPAEAMDSLRVSYSTLRRMIDSGELRAVRVGPGRYLRIPVAELERLVGASE